MKSKVIISQFKTVKFSLFDFTFSKNRTFVEKSHLIVDYFGKRPLNAPYMYIQRRTSFVTSYLISWRTKSVFQKEVLRLKEIIRTLEINIICF